MLYSAGRAYIVRCNQFCLMARIKNAYHGSVVSNALHDDQLSLLLDIVDQDKVGFDACWRLRFNLDDPDYFVETDRDACARDPTYTKMRDLLREMGGGSSTGVPGAANSGNAIDEPSVDRIMVCLAIHMLLDRPYDHNSYEELAAVFDDHPEVYFDRGDVYFALDDLARVVSLRECLGIMCEVVRGDQ